MGKQRTLGRMLFALSIALAVTADGVRTKREEKKKTEGVKKNKDTQKDIIVVVIEA